MNTPSHQTLQFSSPGDAEELQRAELYGLLARLWFAPPDAELLAQFTHAVTEAPQAGGLLEVACIKTLEEETAIVTENLRFQNQNLWQSGWRYCVGHGSAHFSRLSRYCP